jgi:hypothetical protein
MKRFFAVLLMSGLVLSMPSPAATAKPLEHVHLEDSFVEVIPSFCGVARARVEGDTRSHILVNRHGPAGLAYFKENFHGTFSYTNLATGKTMSETIRVVDKDLKVTNNGDGTLTMLVLATGSHKVYANGKLFLSDPGQVRFAFLVDHGGTPADPTDDEFIADLGIIKESTGRNDLEGRDFCEDFILITT